MFAELLKRTVIAAVCCLLLAGSVSCGKKETEPPSSSTASSGTSSAVISVADPVKYLEDNSLIPPEAGKLSPDSPIDRKTLAAICGNILGGTSDKVVSDVSDGDWFANGARRSCDYNLFGSSLDGFSLNKDASVTHYEASRLAVRLYAAITGINDYNTEPGYPMNITDLGELSVEQQWYAYAAMGNGFVAKPNDGFFKPDSATTVKEAADMLVRVINICKQNGDIGAAPAEKIASRFYIYPTKEQKIAETVYMTEYSESYTPAQKRLLMSIQGIVNKGGEATILLSDAHNKYIVDDLKAMDYVKNINTECFSIELLIRKFKDSFTGAIVYDPDKPYTINAACDIAAVDNRIIIEPYYIDVVRGMGILDILDLRDCHFQNVTVMQKWTYVNYWMYMRRDAVAQNSWTNQYNYARDYTIQMKIPTFFLAGDESPDIELNHNLIIEIMSKMPPNIPIFGFPPSQDSAGNLIGLEEYAGVLFMSKLGKYYTAQDYSGNYSFFSRVPVSKEDRKWKPKANLESLKYDPGTTYICVAEVEGGDSPGVMQNRKNGTQWTDENRGKSKYSISVGLAAYDLIPSVMAYYYRTAKPTDDFMACNSGLGYFNNFDNMGKSDYVYASKPIYDDEGKVYITREEAVKDHYVKTDYMMAKAGYKQLCFYTHPGLYLSASDREYISKNVVPNMPNVTSLIPDLSLVVSYDKVDYVNEIIKSPDKSTFLALYHDVIDMYSFDSLGARTFDKSENGNNGPLLHQHDEHAGKDLAERFVKTIKAKPGENMFLGAPFSWEYNFTRIMNAENEIRAAFPGRKIEFVTINEFDVLYYQRENLKK